MFFLQKKVKIKIYYENDIFQTLKKNILKISNNVGDYHDYGNVQYYYGTDFKHLERLKITTVRNLQDGYKINKNVKVSWDRKESTYKITFDFGNIELGLEVVLFYQLNSHSSTTILQLCHNTYDVTLHNKLAIYNFLLSYHKKGGILIFYIKHKFPGNFIRLQHKRLVI